ncbi:SGNH/GDSL hydrolase family protein [Anaerovorax odorimutans]|uniref:SGNH/GDSL hydrolase family protein n=1 Tax=Anaerovorax odorimutans TaxID=109327 RepID=UPI0003FDEBE3|nr:SGNH/GDSL hydrolase family protein [Anaerovorax odorimutans]
MEKLKSLNKISVVGDSILKGVIYDEVAGRYKFLKQSAVSAFEKINQIAVINYSKFGSTVSKGMEKLNKFIVKGTDDSEVVLIEFGGNDCDFDWDKIFLNPFQNHYPNTSYSKFIETISDMIESVLSVGKTPVLMNLPPIDADRYFNWIVKGDENKAELLLKFLGDKNFIYRHQELYSRAIEHIAKIKDIYVINVRDKFLSIPRYSDYLCADGIHPNEKGQEVIKTAFLNAYKERVLLNI